MASTPESTSPSNSSPTISIILLPLVFATILVLTWISRRSPALQAIRTTILTRLPESQKKATLSNTVVNDIPLIEYPEIKAEQKPLLSRRIAVKLGLRPHQLENAQLSSSVIQTCAICTEDFSKGVQVRKLPCEHVFHQSCLDPWLLGFAVTCPMCRLDIQAYTAAGKIPVPPRVAHLRHNGVQMDHVRH
ncbi:hypothetical protein GQ53DRAFT_226719 [Thozetella sp. PMI_491]|nr:hypothetical protein GQ53DRAFT_226719 [Thozetella sp. PMI_491]